MTYDDRLAVTLGDLARRAQAIAKSVLPNTKADRILTAILIINGRECRMTIQEKELGTEHEVRVHKIAQLAAAGMPAWPEHREVTATTQEAKDAYLAASDEATVYALAGRIMAFREHGKTVFVTIQDRAGRVQVYVRSDIIGASLFHTLTHLLDVGDIVWFEGTMFTTKTGEVSLKATTLALLSKCLHPLPEKYHGLTDVEQRYRQRYLDLIVNPESKQKCIERSRIVQDIRSFLHARGFLEVETPMLHPIPGGAAARPFVTKHNAYGMDLYLRIAPELYLKRLVVGGIERVFEINRNFRNEGVSTRHNPEFTMLEFYMAHGDYREGMALTEGLLRQAARAVHHGKPFTYGQYVLDFEQPFARHTMLESITVLGGVPADQLTPERINAVLTMQGREDMHARSYGEKVLTLFEACVEQKIVQPTFIIDFPIEVSPLSRRRDDNPHIAARFELFVPGMELANGFSELNDPFDQAARFQAQAAARTAGDDEAHHYDADYIRALEYGLPPTVGVGIGIDRLTMLLTNTASIKDVILFPTMKNVQV